jgi:hypothetical protein
VYTWSDEWQGESGEEEEMAECIGVPASRSFTLVFAWGYFLSTVYIPRKIRDKGFALGT